MEFLHQPAKANRLGDFLLDNLGADWEAFRAAVAFVKRSGTKHILDTLTAFSKNKAVEIIVGVDLGGTSKEGLTDLLHAVSKPGRIIIFNNPKARTFHPKIYLFKTQKTADVLVGSGNLTEGGIYSNYEAAMRMRLDLRDKSDADLLKSIEIVLDDWADLSKGSARVLDEELLTKLVARGIVPPERLATPEADEPAAQSSNEAGEQDGDEAPEAPMEVLEPLFVGRSEPRAPTISKKLPSTSSAAIATPIAAPAGAVNADAGNCGFIMTLQQTDVGKGQLTAGAAARSPEIFIPLKARDADPGFWGWPDKFLESPTKFDREGVPMRLGSQDIVVNMMCWKLKSDFRLRHEALRSGGNIGDILRLELAPPGSDFEYLVDFVPQGTTMHPVYLARCTQSVPNSKKMFGYY